MESVLPIPLPTTAPTVRSPMRLALRRALRKTGMLVGAMLFAAILLMALLAPLIAPHDPYAQDLSIRLMPPAWLDGGNWSHALGTDSFGRDYLSRIVYGSRISLLIGAAGVVVSGFIGTTMGILAAYYGGWVDTAVGFVVTTRLTLPVVLVALVVVAVLGSSLPLVIGVIGCLLWDRFAVVTRSVALQIVAQDYMVAAHAVGASTLRILLRELLPNLWGSIVVVGTLEMSHAILTEASLSFLGLGTQPPLPSWGLMVAESKQFFFFAPWVVLVPSTALFVLVLAINLLGDGLRDATSVAGRS